MASGLFYCGSIEECPVTHHQISDFNDDFLEACFLCQRSLAFNRDIFMYRGNRAFCSDDCRQEQIEHDEAMERRRNISARAMRKTGNSSSAKQASPSSSTAVSAARSTVAGAVSVA